MQFEGSNFLKYMRNKEFIQNQHQLCWYNYRCRCRPRKLTFFLLKLPQISAKGSSCQRLKNCLIPKMPPTWISNKENFKQIIATIVNNPKKLLFWFAVGGHYQNFFCETQLPSSCHEDIISASLNCFIRNERILEFHFFKTIQCLKSSLWIFNFYSSLSA